MIRALSLAIFLIAVALYGLFRTLGGSHELASAIALGFVVLALAFLAILVAIVLCGFVYSRAKEWIEDHMRGAT